MAEGFAFYTTLLVYIYLTMAMGETEWVQKFRLLKRYFGLSVTKHS
jgi:hypothetical protein